MSIDHVETALAYAVAVASIVHWRLAPVWRFPLVR